ncbi:hypothetical protein ERJ75_000497700 [Trypanosoma vivax]|nr:hypothetical protein ERJ75_000498400 [Trypanosoma vivax]KAH8616285.1 hypothetical protein ERJ75_000497700 [Trypanosoma vivax]
MQLHRHSGVNELVRILPCTCGRAALDAQWRLLLIFVDAERNPGPQKRGAQWNSRGLSQAKRVALERKLHADLVLFCLLQKELLASAKCAAIKIGGHQHVAQARTPHGGGVSILVRDGSGCRGGRSRKEGSEKSDSDTEVLSQCESHDHIGVFPQKDRRFQRVAGHLTGSKRAMAVRADVNSHHVLWDPSRPSDDKGDSIVDWCVQNDLSIASPGSATRLQPGTAALSSPDVLLCRD